MKGVGQRGASHVDVSHVFDCACSGNLVLGINPACQKNALASPCLFHFKLWGAVFLQASMRGWFQAHSWLFFKLLTTAMNMQAQRGRFFFSGLELTCLRKASHVS